MPANYDDLMAALNSGDILSIGEPDDKSLEVNIEVNDPIGVDFKKVINPNKYVLLRRFLDIIHNLPNVAPTIRYTLDSVMQSIDEGGNAKAIIADYGKLNLEQSCIDVLAELAQKLPRNPPKWIDPSELVAYTKLSEEERKETQKTWKKGCNLASENIALISALTTVASIMPNSPKDLIPLIRKGDGRGLYAKYRDKIKTSISIETGSNDPFVKQMFCIIFALLS